MKSFTIEYMVSVKRTATLTARSEKDARDRFEEIRPENSRVLDVIEVGQKTADTDVR